MPKSKDLSGMRYGKLTVIKNIGHAKNKAGKNIGTLWECKCDCGNTTSAMPSQLNYGQKKSCGCLISELLTMRNVTHGQSKTPLYRRWHHMMERCYNPNDRFYYCYGERGIKVCRLWHEFNGFYLWAISTDFDSALQLDRIDVNGNYCPENCRWATTVEQANNTRRNHSITIGGRTKNLSQWAREYGIESSLLRYRIKNGWKEEDLLSPPRTWKNL